MNKEVKLITVEKPFLYLPIYSALKLNLLKTFKPSGDYRVELDENASRPHDAGDLTALSRLIAFAKAGQRAIAVCDPVGLVHLDSAKDHVRVVGAFIKRPSFWLIDRRSTTQHISELHFSDLVYYPQDWETGFYLGKSLARRIQQDHNISVTPHFRKLGQELDYIIEQYEGDKGHFAAVSADILGFSIAVAAIKEGQYSGSAKNMSEFRIVYNFATSQEYGDCVNTGFIVPKFMLESEDYSFVCSFLATMSMSIMQFQIPSDPLEDVYLAIATEHKFAEQRKVPNVPDPLPDKILKEAVRIARNQLQNDGIYTPHFLISRAQWDNSVQVRHLLDGAHNEAFELFDTLVDMRAANEAWDLVNKVINMPNTSNESTGEYAEQMSALQQAVVSVERRTSLLSDVISLSVFCGCLSALAAIIAFQLGIVARGPGDISIEFIIWSVGALVLSGLAYAESKRLVTNGKGELKLWGNLFLRLVDSPPVWLFVIVGVGGIIVIVCLLFPNWFLWLHPGIGTLVGPGGLIKNLLATLVGVLVVVFWAFVGLLRRFLK